MMTELVDYVNLECYVCGQTSEQIAEDQNWNDDDFADNSITTNAGHWVCFDQCRL